MTDIPDLGALFSSLAGKENSSAPANDLSDPKTAAFLSSVLGEGDLAERLSETLKNVDLSALLGSLGSSDANKSGDANKEVEGQSSGAKQSAADMPNLSNTLAALPALLGSLGGASKAKGSETRALLKAIRPFVGERRQRAIDMFIGIEGIAAILPGGNANV